MCGEADPACLIAPTACTDGLTDRLRGGIIVHPPDPQREHGDVTEPATTTGAAWRRFWRIAIASIAAPAVALFAFVAIVDPWAAFPLSPPLPRHPASSQARYALPMLARSPRFDSAIIGTSTARLIRPAALDALLDARFVTLAFDAATADEQAHMLALFLRAHPRARYVMIGMDIRWCDPGPEQTRFPGYEFPEWLYAPTRWSGYRSALTLFAIRESWAQLEAMLGLKPPPRAPDGYSAFAGAETAWNLPRALAHIAEDGIMPGPPDPQAPPASWPTVTLPRLSGMLATMPPATGALLFFPPFAQSYQGPPSGSARRYWAECKRRVSALARARPGTAVADFLIDSAFTRDPANYYDGMHYRTTVADRLAGSLALAFRGVASPGGDDVILTASDD